MRSVTSPPVDDRDAAASLTVQSFAAEQADDWDDLVRRSCNGTFLHTRRFLSYHRDRFADRSLQLHDRRGRLIGVLPAAVSPADPETIVSHPGLTYGGLVHDGSVRGASMIAALREAAEHYRRLGYRRLRYKAVPAIYHSVPADDDRYALFRLGAQHNRSDLSATIDLSRRGRVSQRRMRSRKAAEAAAASTSDSWDGVEEFWGVLEANLAQRHRASPVHTVGEIQLLHSLFPDEITLITARVGQALAGGTVLFAVGPVLHMQYTATTSQGRAACVTDLMMERGIELARDGGYQYFDFGISTLGGGQVLDENLYQFKVSFGAGGVTYDHYEIDLQGPLSRQRGKSRSSTSRPAPARHLHVERDRAPAVLPRHPHLTRPAPGLAAARATPPRCCHATGEQREMRLKVSTEQRTAY